MIFVAHAINFTCGRRVVECFVMVQKEKKGKNPHCEDDYDHSDDWDSEELLLDKEDEEEEGHIDGYTISKRAYLNHIDNFEAALDNNNDNEANNNNNYNDEGNILFHDMRQLFNYTTLLLGVVFQSKGKL